MQKLWKDNPWYFSVFILFLLGGIPFLFYGKGALLSQVNDQHFPFADFFFSWFTKVGEAYGYLMVFFILFVYRRRAAWGVPLLGIAVTLVSWATKTMFHQPRPYAYFKGSGLLDYMYLVPGVKIHKGFTSFPSGHTMAAFALFSFLAFCFPRKPWISICCFFAAFLVGFSRMYLFQHFFEDVYSGAILGFLLGIAAYLLLNQLEEKLLVKA